MTRGAVHDGPLRPSVRILLGQIDAGTDRAANAAVAVDLLRSAAARGADLMVLPEYSSFFDPRGVGPHGAEPLDGSYVSTLREHARRSRIAVIAGVCVPGSRADRAVNTVVGIDAAGGIVGVYRKVHLYDAFGHRESDRLEAGSALAEPLVLEVAGVRFGVITCYDLRFPESARRVVDAGAEVVVVPAAWATGPGKAEQWRALAVARAIENTSAVLAVGQAGKGRVGRSVVVGPDGTVVVELGATPGQTIIDLDPAGIAAVRERDPSLQNRRFAVVPRDERPDPRAAT